MTRFFPRIRRVVAGSVAAACLLGAVASGTATAAIDPRSRRIGYDDLRHGQAVDHAAADRRGEAAGADDGERHADDPRPIAEIPSGRDVTGRAAIVSPG